MKEYKKIYIITSVSLLTFLSIFLIIIYNSSYSYLGNYNSNPTVNQSYFFTPVAEKIVIKEDEIVDLTVNNTNIPDVSGVHIETVSSSILVIKDSELDYAEKNYKVSLSVENNTLNFNSGEVKILLKLTDNNGSLIETVDGLNYTTENINGENYSGFDITNISEDQVLSQKNRISANSTNKNPEDIWEAEIIFLDANGLINNNLNETYKASLKIEEISVSLNELIFSHNGGKDSIEVLSSYYLSEDIAKMYKINDNYGESYYYNGYVNNNYIKFGGFLWRIVRINGDGSIKLIYVDEDSVELTEDEEESSYYFTNTIGDTRYNISRFNLEYSAYMYESGVANGLTTNSLIKTFIDNWYVANLISYESYLSDTVFCAHTNVYYNEEKIDTMGYYRGTFLSFEYRLFDYYFSDYENFNEQIEPYMACENKLQAYTVDDVVNGNGALTYPIGLLTAFEYDMGYSYSTGTYLEDSLSVFTMTPYQYSSSYSSGGIFMESMGGTSQLEYYRDVRPVINLKMDTLATGLGTWYSPYIVS